MSNQWTYNTLFKNFAKKKYFKALKRLRTLFASYLFGVEKNRVPRGEQEALHVSRREILDLYNTDLGVMNQIKNRLESLQFLMTKLSKDELKPVVDDILLDLKSIDYDVKDKFQFDEESLKKLQSDVTREMHQKALSYFKRYYYKHLRILPFRLNFD